MISVKFESEEEIYTLDYNDLLSSITEMPFVSKDELPLGTKVLAPWIDGASSTVSYAAAVIVASPDAEEGTL